MYDFLSQFLWNIKYILKNLHTGLLHVTAVQGDHYGTIFKVLLDLCEEQSKFKSLFIDNLPLQIAENLTTVANGNGSLSQ